jgi:predicted  nucleic acid-binding Zn-ribbon protein
MKKGMSIQQVVNGAEIGIHKLPHMETLYKQVEDEVNKLQYARQSLVNEIRTLERKISILDKTAFSIEQDSRRTEQRLQELANKKDRLEKLIAHILNEEEYLKLMHIIKENIKAILSDNKKLISISFVPLI